MSQPPPDACRAVLFDLDGTLLDTAPDFVTALNRLLAAHRLAELDPAVIRAAVTNGSAGLVTMGFGLQPGDAGFDDRKQEFLDYYAECLHEQTRLFPGMESLLTRLLDRGIPWGIVTNKPELYTLAILEQLWLPAPPATIVCPDHVTHTKPHPEPVLRACEALAVRAEDVFVVGDHRRDIEAGLAAGCMTVAAAYGYLHAEESADDWGAHHLVDHPAELYPIIFPTHPQNKAKYQ